MLPVIFLVNLQTQLEDHNAPDKHACKRMWNIYDDVICCKAPPPNLNSANIFLRSVWGQTAKLKDRQYFRLYDTILMIGYSDILLLGLDLVLADPNFYCTKLDSLLLWPEKVREREKGSTQQAKLLMCFIPCTKMESKCYLSSFHV